LDGSPGDQRCPLVGQGLILPNGGANEGVPREKLYAFRTPPGKARREGENTRKKKTPPSPTLKEFVGGREPLGETLSAECNTDGGVWCPGERNWTNWDVNEIPPVPHRCKTWLGVTAGGGGEKRK